MGTKVQIAFYGIEGGRVAVDVDGVRTAVLKDGRTIVKRIDSALEAVNVFRVSGYSLADNKGLVAEGRRL